MTRNLDELKSELYNAFDKAMGRFVTAPSSQESGFLQAAGEIAQAIVQVEARLDERKASGGPGLKG